MLFFFLVVLKNILLSYFRFNLLCYLSYFLQKIKNWSTFLKIFRSNIGQKYLNFYFQFIVNCLFENNVDNSINTAFFVEKNFGQCKNYNKNKSIWKKMWCCSLKLTECWQRNNWKEIWNKKKMQLNNKSKEAKEINDYH